MIGELRVLIPGEPVAQSRPRAFKLPNGQIRTYDPQKSRVWKATAQQHIRAALDRVGLTEGVAFDGPVRCSIVAVFTCPRSHWRKNPLPRRAHTKRPDIENVGKAFLDAATGIAWIDDAQVCELEIRKVVGAQGEEPRVEALIYRVSGVAEIAPLFAQRSA